MVGAWKARVMSEVVLFDGNVGALNDQRRWKAGSGFWASSVLFLCSLFVLLSILDLIPLNDHCPGPLSNFFVSSLSIPVFSLDVFIGKFVLCFGLACGIAESFLSGLTLLGFVLFLLIKAGAFKGTEAGSTVLFWKI